jgi:hypothetical protein
MLFIDLHPLTPVLKLSVLKQRLFLLVSITSTNDGSHPFIKYVRFLTIFAKSKISHKSSTCVVNIAIFIPPSMVNYIFTNHMNILLDKGSKFIENYKVIGDLNYDILIPQKSQVLDLCDIFDLA